MDFNDDRERVRQQVDLVELIGQQISLRRQGRIYVGICPWHDDSKPSLQVNPERQSWKCWVCNIGGDIFSYTMQSEGIDFREALKMLAERAGVSLGPANAISRVEPGSPNDKNALYGAMAWAERLMHEFFLNASEAQPARAYCQARGISSEMINRFKIGFAPDQWQWLVDSARSTALSPEILEAVGLIGRSAKSNRPYDRFKGRLIFPIRDVQRRPIALGGRILPEFADENAAKYINSPETRLFSKSDQLYGLDLARDAVTKTREIVIMEGYTDVVMAHQTGITEAAAVLGTALNQRHIRLLRRFADRIILVLDGDEAGQRRAREVLEMFVAEQVDVRILTLPEKLDPCDFLLAHGEQPFRAMLDQAVDALEHLFQVETAGFDPVSDTHRANLAMERILKVVAQAGSAHAMDSSLRLRQQQLLARLGRHFRLPEEEIRQRLTALRKIAPNSNDDPSRSVLETPAVVITLKPHEREMLELLLLDSSLVARAASEVGVAEINSEQGRLLYQLMLDQYECGESTELNTILLLTDDPVLKSLLIELDEHGQEKHERSNLSTTERWDHTRDRFREVAQRRRQRQQQAASEESGSSDEQNLNDLQQFLEQRRNDSRM